MAKKADIPNQVIDAALALAAEQGWRDLSLADIAAAAKLPLSKVHPVYSSKAAVLAGFLRRVDAAVLAEPAEEGSARDRLFDVLMRRFDALQPHREALANIAHDELRAPLGALCSLCALRRSMALMLETAGLDSTGLRGALRVKGLSAAYLASFRVWLRDDSPDMARTMAALDGYLRRIEGLIQRLPRRRSRNAAGAATPGAAPGTRSGGPETSSQPA
ncbi:MAG: TetR family transcriptional regulator [Kiloniellales bacterium]